jgi:hypothetical protein
VSLEYFGWPFFIVSHWKALADILFADFRGCIYYRDIVRGVVRRGASDATAPSSKMGGQVNVLIEILNY